MTEFKKYRRKQIAELRPVTEQEISSGELLKASKESGLSVSISDFDLKNGSPKIGDMIARNPEDHTDQWLVAEHYFNDNFESL